MLPRKFLQILLARCPAYREPLADCALSALRTVPGSLPAGDQPLLTEEQMERLSALSEDEVDECIRKHFLCLCRKNGCGT